MDTRPKIIPASALPAPPYTLATARVPALTADYCRALAAAKAPGRPLIVVLASDAHGGPYPLDERSRAQLVAAVAEVDHVVICDQPETERLVAAAPPESVVDLESQVGRDVVADVLERHPPA